MGAVDFAFGALGSIAKCSSPSRILWGAVTPHFTEDSFVFGSGVEAQTSPVMFLVVMRKFAITTEELGMRVSIELDRKDVLSLIAVFLLMLPDSGALRGSEAGESLLYLIHRNNVHADAMLGPIEKGAKNGA